MPARILFVGDIHLGRRPGRLPENLGEFDVAVAELTPVAAWRRVVRYAVEAEVDAVVLAGDVVEADNARFEAYGQLQDGVRRLLDGGIAVYAVSGNHDVDALPRMAEAIDGFRLLGRGGRWEVVTIRRDDRPIARLAGWSFPVAQQTTSPLGAGDFVAKDADLPLLGVLHCDLLSPDSSYAPVSRVDLERTAMDGWFLGHVHKPDVLERGRPIGYLGALVGLDPSETGPHGPWLVRVGGNEPIEVEQLPLAPLRWETVELDAARVGAADELDRAIHRTIEEFHGGVAATLGEARAVGCRVRLTGMSALHRELRRRTDAADLESLRFNCDGVLYFVDKVTDESRPEIDLESLAGEDHPPGLLARKLLALEKGGEQATTLLQQARRELMRVSDDRIWAQLDPVELDDRMLHRLLLDSGTRALEELLEQVGEGRV